MKQRGWLSVAITIIVVFVTLVQQLQKTGGTAQSPVSTPQDSPQTRSGGAATDAPHRNPGPSGPTKPGLLEGKPQENIPGDGQDDRRIVDAAKNRRSDVLVQTKAKVTKVLPDDRDGAAHQRLIVELRNGHSLLIAHNIDLAPRVPCKAGDVLEFKGEFEWNEQGGVIHWTHHDPGKRRPGGWIKLDGKVYE